MKIVGNHNHLQHQSKYNELEFFCLLFSHYNIMTTPGMASDIKHMHRGNKPSHWFIISFIYFFVSIVHFCKYSKLV